MWRMFCNVSSGCGMSGRASCKACGFNACFSCGSMRRESNLTGIGHFEVTASPCPCRFNCLSWPFVAWSSRFKQGKNPLSASSRPQRKQLMIVEFNHSRAQLLSFLHNGLAQQRRGRWSVAPRAGYPPPPPAAAPGSASGATGLRTRTVGAPSSSSARATPTAAKWAVSRCAWSAARSRHCS